MRHFLCLILLLTLAELLHASVIPADRSVDWSQVGVAGGVPNVTTIFTNMTGLDATGNTDISAAVNNAMSLCPSNQVVSLPAGQFLLTNTLKMQNGVVLRGQGTSTVVLGNYNGTLVNFYGPFWGWDRTNLLSGYTKGSSNIVVQGLPLDLAVGSKIQITESNDVSLVTQCGSDGCSGQFCMGQWVQITGIAGTTLTVWPPLYYNYTNACSPFIYYPFNGSAYAANFIDHAGIENLVLTNINSGSGVVNFSMSFASQCWVRNVNSYYGSVCHIWTFDTYRCEIRDSLFAGVMPPITSSRGYGMQMGTPNSPNPTSKTTALLCENNVWEGCRGAIVPGYGTAGCVFGYNYFANETNETASILRCDIFIHSAQPMMNLYEGNVGACINGDNFHGSGAYGVIFRNLWRGRDAAKVCVSSLRSVEMDAYQWDYSVVGNVLGYPGITNDMAVLTNPTGALFYLTATPTNNWSYGNSYRALMFGYDGEGGGTTIDDTNAYRTALVTGNYDYVQNQTTWDTNGVQTLPASLYLTAQPSWWTNWGNTPWPPIGPDLTTKVSQIPAQLRMSGGSSTNSTAQSNTTSYSASLLPPSSLAVQFKVQTTPSTSSSGPSSTTSGVTNFQAADSYSGTSSGSCQAGYYWSGADQYLAVKFTASASYVVASNALALFKTGNPSRDLSINIFNDNSGVPGSALGTWSATVSESSLSTTESSVSFPNFSASLVNGTTYWLVLHVSGKGDGTNYTDWGYVFNAGQGNAMTSADSVSWSSVSSNTQLKFTLFAPK